MVKLNLAQRVRAHIGTDGCWTWPGRLDKNGYAAANVGNNGRVTRVRVHRFAYELLTGPIPDGKQIDHLCRNKACFNPAHLDVVTPRENVMRSDNACARNARKTHCQRGHPYTPDNTYIVTLRTGSRERLCKACCAERHRRRKATGWKQVERRKGRRRVTRQQHPSSPS
jgi:hypothetical protein